MERAEINLIQFLDIVRESHYEKDILPVRNCLPFLNYDSTSVEEFLSCGEILNRFASSEIEFIYSGVTEYCDKNSLSLRYKWWPHRIQKEGINLSITVVKYQFEIHFVFPVNTIFWVSYDGKNCRRRDLKHFEKESILNSIISHLEHEPHKRLWILEGL